jgi:DNA end-binding protein Ku
MVPRAYWKGYLRLSLVQCPIALYPATTERAKIRFHLINTRTGHRIRYLKVDAETGKPVDDDDIIKAYEISKSKYIEITDDELEAVALKSKHTI